MLCISVFPHVMMTEEQVSNFTAAVTNLLTDLDSDTWVMSPSLKMIGFKTSDMVFVDMSQFKYAIKEAAKAAHIGVKYISVSYYSM